MTALRTYRDLARNGPLTRLLAGEFVSSIGDWLYLVALLIVVYQRSQDPVLLGIVGAARVLPYVLLSVPAGFAADRFDRRRILMLTDVARGLIMVALAVLVAVDGPLALIVALAILATCFSTFFGPTIGSYLPTLVADERQLGPANSAWATLDNLAFVLGPALGGLLIAAGGLTVAFVLNAVSFAAVTLVLWRLPSSRGATGTAGEPALGGLPALGGEPALGGAEAAPGAGATSGPDAAIPPATTAQGAMTSPAERPMRLRIVVGLGLMEAIDAFAFGGLGILTVVLASSVYGTGDAGTGALNAAMGVGEIVGALVSGALVLRADLGPPIWLGGLAMGAGLVVLGPTTQFAVALVALALAAAGSLVLEVVSATLFQRAVPDRLRGRALGVMATASTLLFALGSLVAPPLADRFGMAPLLAGAGILVIAATAIGRTLVGAQSRRPEDRATTTFARVAGLPIFAGVSAARLEQAVRQSRQRPVTEGVVVIRQGDVADRFYIIAAGRFRVTQTAGDAPAVLRDMGPDEVFGEIGLLRRTPRTATVTALTDGLLLELDGADFLALVGSASGLGARLLDLHRGSLAGEPHASEVSPI